MDKKSSKRFLRRNTESNIEDMKEDVIEKIKKYTLKTYNVNLQDRQVFNVALKQGTTITVAIDEEGNIFPECFRTAITQEILK